MSTNVRATIEDLRNAPGKAEIVDGEIVIMAPTGDMPARAGFKVARSLSQMEGKLPGRAYPDNVGFKVHLPNRDSFSPDASFYVGPSAGMKFLEGPPIFAVEVRSESDYGPTAEAAIAKKRADYFTAGTIVVWDVDLLSPDVVKSYVVNSPDDPRIFRRGQIADAEPAVPGWKILVDELFS
jgi:Uma2 family endonuclease